ncbi:MAG: deoxyribose-phosphate aldolase [Bacteriovoracaceae bacterium]
MPSVKLRDLAIPHYPIDMVMVNERANTFTKRSIKKESKIEALYTCIEMMDLTTLEGADTPGKVRSLCAKAINPVAKSYQDILLAKNLPAVPSTAAVCVYPSYVSLAKECLAGTSINVASVATAFPSGQLSINMKVKEVEKCVKDGADEIDMVINRGAFLSGKYQTVFDEIVAVKEACGKAHLKVILETGELFTFDKVRLASTLAMEAGADFIKTSTGKVQPAATIPVTLVMLQAIWDYYQATGKKIGMKPAGGIRTSKQAIHYLIMINEVMGDDWLNPDMFRFGQYAFK